MRQLGPLAVRLDSNRRQAIRLVSSMLFANTDDAQSGTLRQRREVLDEVAGQTQFTQRPESRKWGQVRHAVVADVHDDETCQRRHGGQSSMRLSARSSTRRPCIDDSAETSSRPLLCSDNPVSPPSAARSHRSGAARRDSAAAAPAAT